MWCKELMLLSRKLDPAIGNINRQPESLVKEIADWIQNTWEYSSRGVIEAIRTMEETQKWVPQNRMMFQIELGSR